MVTDTINWLIAFNCMGIPALVNSGRRVWGPCQFRRAVDFLGLELELR